MLAYCCESSFWFAAHEAAKSDQAARFIKSGMVGA